MNSSLLPSKNNFVKDF